MDMFKDRIKNFLIISIATVLLYCYTLHTRTYVAITTYAQTAIEPPSASIQADLDVINTYFQKQVIVVKSRVYYKNSSILLESEYNRAGQEIKNISYRDGSVSMWEEYEYREDGQRSAWIQHDKDGSVFFYVEYKYDDAGNLIEDTAYNRSGNITDKSTYAYDEAGNLIESTEYKRSDNITDKSTYVYDEEGNIIEEVQYHGDDIYRQYEYEYVEAGKREKRVEYNDDGDVTAYEEYEYEYDEAGNVIKREYHDLLGEKESYNAYKYRYNEAGDIEKKIAYDKDGNIDCWWEYRYDEAGNLLSEITFDSGGICERKEYRYDENGKEIKHTELVGLAIDRQYEYCYDEWGNLTDRGRYTYEYEYETVYTSRQSEQPAIVYKREYHDKTLTCQTEYDRAGRKIEEIVYVGNGSNQTQIEYTYVYDKAGNLIVKLIVNQNNGITSTQRETYTYNETDDMTEWRRFFNNELRTRWEYEYDRMGKQKSCTVYNYNKDGDISFTIYYEHEYEYDETGNVISDTVYHTTLSSIETESYDTAQGQGQYKYEYDEAGRKEKEIYYWNGKMELWYEWEYDEKGRMLVETTYSIYDGSIAAQDKYEYDSDGKKVKKIRTGYGNPEEEITEYSYDEYENLIEERTGERSITYEYIYE